MKSQKYKTYYGKKYILFDVVNNKEQGISLVNQIKAEGYRANIEKHRTFALWQIYVELKY